MKLVSLLSLAAVASLALAEPRPVRFDASGDTDWSVDDSAADPLASTKESASPNQDSATDASINDQAIDGQDAFAEASRNSRVSNDFFNFPHRDIPSSVFAAGTPTDGATKVPNNISWASPRQRGLDRDARRRRLRRSLLARKRRQYLIRRLRNELRRRRRLRRQAIQNLRRVRVNRKNGNALDCVCRRGKRSTRNLVGRGRRPRGIRSRGRRLSRKKGLKQQRRGITNLLGRNKRRARRNFIKRFGRGKPRNGRRYRRGNRGGLRTQRRRPRLARRRSNGNGLRRGIKKLLGLRSNRLDDLFSFDRSSRRRPSRRSLRLLTKDSVRRRRALGIPSRLRSFCNKLVYVNGRPSYNKSPRTRLLPYTKPQFPATASTTEQGALIIQRNGPARNLPDGALHKFGFQTATSVQVPRRARLVRFYSQVRFTENPAISSASNKCRVKNAAVSFFYGAKRIGGRVFRDGSLPIGKWIPVAVTSRSGRLARSPQRITVQAAHNFEGDAECQDGLQLEVRRILTCINTRRTLFQTAAVPEFSVGDEFLNDNAVEDADFAIGDDAAEWEDALEDDAINDDSANEDQVATTIESIDDSAETDASLSNNSVADFSQQGLFNEEFIDNAQFATSDNIADQQFSSDGLTEEDALESEGLDEDSADFAFEDSLDADNLEDDGLDLEELDNTEFSLNEDGLDEDAIDEDGLDEDGADEADFAIADDAIEEDYIDELDSNAADFSGEDAFEDEAADEDAIDGEFSAEDTIDEEGANEDATEGEYSEEAQIDEDGIDEVDHAHGEENVAEEEAAQEDYADEDSAIVESDAAVDEDGADQEASQEDSYTEDEGVDESQFSLAQDGYDYDYANLKDAIDAAQASGSVIIIASPKTAGPPPPPPRPRVKN